MTEYWVSQGNKWCDYCKIFIANNATSIRTHEFGQRHKENVAKKLADIRKENAAKEKEKQQAVKDLERIEMQARRSYEKDLAASKMAEVSACASDQQGPHKMFVRAGEERLLISGSSNASLGSTGTTSGHPAKGNVNDWTRDEASGYYFNAATGYYYDSNSGLYYSDLLGKWTTQEAAFKVSQETMTNIADGLSTKKVSTPSLKVPTSVSRLDTSSKTISGPPGHSMSKASNAVPPGPVLLPSQSRNRPGKGVASSLEVGKRKREEKTGPVASEEAAALAAREAARKRTQEREKSLLGLYQSY